MRLASVAATLYRSANGPADQTRSTPGFFSCRPRRPGAGVAGGSGPRRAFHCGARRSCRWSECRKSLQAPGLGAFRRLTRGGQCVHASDHQGSESGKQEAHLESGVLYQPLQESGGEVEAKAKAALRLCQDAAGGARRMEACARYASIFTKIGHWVNEHVMSLSSTPSTKSQSICPSATRMKLRVAGSVLARRLAGEMTRFIRS